nr:MAG TPA: hypothetical protein [Caudoviricetes sp.]
MILNKIKYTLYICSTMSYISAIFHYDDNESIFTLKYRSIYLWLKYSHLKRLMTLTMSSILLLAMWS